MSDYSKYEMTHIVRPKQTDYTTMYYYKEGKVVGERRFIDGETVYYELLGARREVTGVEKLDFKTSEKVVDEEGFKTEMDAYNNERARRTELFITDMMCEYDLSRGEVKYFLDNNDTLEYTEDALNDFTDYQNRY